MQKDVDVLRALSDEDDEDVDDDIAEEKNKMTNNEASQRYN